MPAAHAAAVRFLLRGGGARQAQGFDERRWFRVRLYAGVRCAWRVCRDDGRIACAAFRRREYCYGACRHRAGAQFYGAYQHSLFKQGYAGKRKREKPKLFFVRVFRHRVFHRLDALCQRVSRHRAHDGVQAGRGAERRPHAACIFDGSRYTIYCERGTDRQAEGRI